MKQKVGLYILCLVVLILVATACYYYLGHTRQVDTGSVLVKQVESGKKGATFPKARQGSENLPWCGRGKIGV